MPPSRFLFYFSITVVWIGHFLVDMMIGIWPVYKTLAHLDLGLAGLISGLCAFLGEGMQIFFGSLSDRGYRKFLVLGGVLAATASAYFVYVSDYLSFFILYLVTCIGSGAFHPSGASLISDLPSSRKGLLLTIFASGGSLGLAFSQLIFIQTHSWLEGETMWLALPATLLMLVAVFSRIGISHHTKSPPHRLSTKKIFGLLKIKEVYLLYITTVCGAALLWGIIFLLPDLLQSRGYSSWVALGGGHMTFVLGGALMMIPAGYLADKYSAKHVIIGCLGLGAISFYSFLLFPSLNEMMLLILLFLTGASVATINPITIAMGTHLFPHSKGVISAILMGMVWCIAEGIGQTGGGFLTKCFEADAPAKALAVLGFLFLLGMATASRLQEEAKELTPALEPVNQSKNSG